MSFKASQGNNQTYNNADSFAMAFDEAWKNYSSKHTNGSETTVEKIEIILQQIQSHPFLKDYPDQAKQVVEFRIRLLNLE